MRGGSIEEICGCIFPDREIEEPWCSSGLRKRGSCERACLRARLHQIYKYAFDCNCMYCFIVCEYMNMLLIVFVCICICMSMKCIVCVLIFWLYLYVLLSLFVNI
jgi:hypothetical protein